MTDSKLLAREIMMEITLSIIGIIALVFGLGLWLFPRFVIRAGEYLNRVLSTDETVMAQRVLWGLVFVACGVAILYKVFF